MFIRILLVLFGCTPLPLLCQNMHTGLINGKLVDSSTKKPLPLATISIFSAVDTTLITYRMSNTDGEFKVSGLPLNRQLRMLISYTGYAVERREFLLTADHPQIMMGTLSMFPDAHSLDEILLFAERPPVIMKNDTIEFNASSFKTLPAALVEDLLKKLPGVLLDGDGNITVNGRKVNRILVDGREFFGGDMKMATKNLPANIIDKVQVSNDQDELELNPDKAKASIGQIINLKLKKEVKKGWFGKAYAGAGTDRRFEAGSIINMFRDTLQVSVLGFINNINRPGFGYSDIRKLGGFDRSGISSISNVNGGLTINGISFGGTGEGIQNSGGAGFNLNNVFKKGTTLNSQYFYGQSTNNISELTNRQQFFGDTTLTTRSEREEVYNTYNHRLGFVLKMKPNANTRIEYRPGFVISDQKSNSHTGVNTTRHLNEVLNTSNNQQSLKGADMGFSHSLSIFKNYKKKGRSLIFYQVLNYNRTNNDQINTALNIFSSGDTTTLDQLRERLLHSVTTTNTLTFNEPLSKNLQLRLSYAFHYFNNGEKQVTFNKDITGSNYKLINSELSSNLTRTMLRHNLSAGIVRSIKNITVTGTVNLLRLNILNSYHSIAQKLNQHYQYVLPGISIDWNALNLAYSINVNPPAISEIRSVPDNTNPLYIIKGNPDLKPVKTHNIYLNFYKNIPQKTLSLNAYLNGNFSKDGIIRSRMVAPNGVQTTIPMNADGIQSIYNQFYLSKQYRLHKDFQVTAALGYYINYLKNFLVINTVKGYVKIVDLGPYLRTGINWKDKIEWNMSYSNGIYNAYYESPGFNNLKVHRQGLGTDVVIRWPKKFVWESSLDYRYNSQAAPGIQKNIALLSAGLTWLFLKADKGQLRLYTFDILNQNRSVTRFTAENYIQDRQLNILQRYFMLTFTYNIRDFKASRIGGKQSLFLF